MIGKTISHYKILQQLDKSGMGKVYKAIDTRLDRPVAIKMIPKPKSFLSVKNGNVLNEARTVSSLNHPNIITVHDVDSNNGDIFIIMEFVEGQSLRKIITDGPLQINTALNLLYDICLSIKYAHDRKIVHLDIKPENIMINDCGQIKILDFGLAKFKQSNNQFDKNIITGTIEYMSPERFHGEIGDKKSDIFSIGVMFYEMLTGIHPFVEKHQAATIYNILNANPIPSKTINPQISNNLNQIIEKSICKDNDLRYQDLNELLNDLKIIIDEINIDSKEKISPTKCCSIAVIPFAIIGNKKEFEYIGEGIAEDLINKLSRINQLKVASSLSSFKYRSSTDDIRQIGKNLNVQSILQGTVERSGNEIRFSVQLINVKDGYILWSDNFDSTFENIFKIRDEITSHIIQSLRIVLTGEEVNKIEKAYTDKSVAYDYYLRGRSYFRQMRRIGIESAIKMYSKAIEIDRKYTLAYSGLANCYSFLHQYWESSIDIAEKALNASIVAIQLDNNLAEAHVAFGLAYSLINEYEKSEKAFQNAIELNPHLFEAYYFDARIKFEKGQIKSAMFLYEKACQVQPDDYQSPYFLATIYKSMDRNSDAIKIFNKCINNCKNQLHINPTNVRALYMGAAALVHIGKTEQGLEWAVQALDMDPDEPATYYNVACAYTAANKIEKGLEYLDKAVHAGFARKDWIKFDSDLDPLRSNPKFDNIIQKLK